MVRNRKNIEELPHAYKMGAANMFIGIDEENANFRRGVKYEKIHVTNDGAYYIWYGGTTYYL